jgi:cyclopropane-fatty-acyl-phospholipid synthase
MQTALRGTPARPERAPQVAPPILAALERLLGGPPGDFAVELWTGERLGPAPGVPPRFTLRLAHAGALRRMLWPPGELSLAEAFVRGDFEVEGDLAAAFALRERFSPRPSLLLDALRLASFPARPGATARAAHLRGALHGRERDALAIRHHYDLGNDFYALWLDRRMVYSCAYFPSATASLDRAQEAKLELVCRKLRLAPGERLLDVGCGWGGLVTWAAEHHGVEAVGVTLSPRQAEWARARIGELGLAGRCRVEVMDYRDLGNEAFDKVASVGMFEHVGLRRLPEYFRQVHRLLAPGGVFLNHGIAALEPRPPWWRRLFLREGAFIERYIFPDGEIPPFLATARAAAAAGFELRDVESLREHYALTCRSWVDRLERRREEAVRAVGEGTWRAWRLYLAGSAHDFERAGIGVYQALYVKPRHGRSGLPLGREDWYRPSAAPGG